MLSQQKHDSYDESHNRFLELGSILDPGRLPKTDKAAILVDAVLMVNQLRSEARKLKESNSSLQEKVKELKASLHGFFFFMHFHGETETRE